MISYIVLDPLRLDKSTTYFQQIISSSQIDVFNLPCLFSIHPIYITPFFCRFATTVWTIRFDGNSKMESQVYLVTLVLMTSVVTTLGNIQFLNFQSNGKFTFTLVYFTVII